MDKIHSRLSSHQEMKSANAKTHQNPSTSDTIMASALLAFSRNNTDADAAAAAARSSDAVLLVQPYATTNSPHAEAKTTQSK